MNKVKTIAMYLPQFHVIPENSKFWGEGFTDWVGVKKSSPIFEGHEQPRVPLNKNYYDLSIKENIAWQAKIAKENGVYGFAMYHYWFSNDHNLLTKPSELLLENKYININFCFAWDNSNWKRTWSKLRGNDWSPVEDRVKKESNHDEPEILMEYVLGEEDDWKVHFEYLLSFFKDKRYIKHDNKPMFIIFNWSEKISQMANYWDHLARENGFAGMYMIYRPGTNVYFHNNECNFTYEPTWAFSGNLFARIVIKMHNLLGIKRVWKYDYDKVWNTILKRAENEKDSNRYYGAIVRFDDTPRRGKAARIILNDSPQKFSNYYNQLIKICKKQNKEYIFLTAWNEWGEGSYLEPDEKDRYDYLEALHNAIINS